MKKFIAFLLVLFIFVSPVTTLVKADVVIGDNDETVINENGSILGRKIALMESLSDLALSGVTEFTISNTTDVDTYLDSLWSEIDDAIDYLESGNWANDLSNEIASKYFTNLVQYKNYINNRGDYLAHLLPSGNPTSNLLSTFFANNIFGKHSTLHNNLSLDTFKALSALTRTNNPNPEPDFSFISNIKYIYYSRSNVSYLYQNYDTSPSRKTGAYSISYTSDNMHHVSYLNSSSNPSYSNFSAYDGILTINLNSNGSGGYNATYSGANLTNNVNVFNLSSYYNNTKRFSFAYESSDNKFWISPNTTNYNFLNYQQGSFEGLSTAINYIYLHFANIDLYVDGELWAVNGNNVPTSPILDIDGYLKIYGNNSPIQYELQSNTKINYDQLYQVIYNAIRDNLPISQGDINYYDSHDTIYSPTIINNYGEEEGNESDLIDTILDYAVIPKFDTAIAQPMRQALTNGVVIMNNSITNVIPNEILLILGACFFLLLFAVVINRMIK